jgi:hypothetical protein
MPVPSLDTQGDREACFIISDKVLTIGGGVLEAGLTPLNVVGG